MHEPYEARRFEREEKKGSVHYGWRSFRACPQRESDSWPSVPETDALSTELQGRGVVSRLGLTPDLLYVRYNKRRIECRGKNQFEVLPLSSSSWFRTRTMGSKDPCAAVTPRRNVRERIGHVCPTAFRHADPTRFADWIPGPIPWPITADRLADGARVELARDFRPNSLSRTAPLPHGPPSMPVFSVLGTPAKPR